MAASKDSANTLFEDEQAAHWPANENSLNYIAESKARSVRSAELALKRSLDISVSATVLLILAPVLILILVLIRLESPGSPIFSQLRWGKDGKKIRIYKFRSMRSDVGDPTGVKQTVKNDPRVTRIGAFLRRTNLDEIPQLYNVLRGDMSLVGPRCHAVGMLANGVLYEELVPEYHRRHVMRPGLTGLAQMRGLRGPTDRPSKARARINADLYYVENFSFAFDLMILLGTLRSELTRGQGF
ncbi:sugar transferase [Agrobacterium cavarae]|uniref:sugar transferase n=1 Tax=Agrobacterium cavarae TaxID=2528239 RepID=UPI003FD1B0E5